MKTTLKILTLVLLLTGARSAWGEVVVLTSYSEGNRDSSIYSMFAQYLKHGQSITTPAGTNTLTKIKFFLSKQGSPSGTLSAELYAFDGSAPTGSVLATSQSVNITTLPSYNTFQLIDFVFTDNYVLSPNTQYFIVLNGSEAIVNESNYVFFGRDYQGGYSGGAEYYYEDTWFAEPLYDAIFYVYGENGEESEVGLSSATAMQLGMAF